MCMSKLLAYRRQITQDMDTLQILMESNTHLSDPAAVERALERLTFKWSFISEEDRDYIQAAQGALEDGTPWT